MKLFDYVRALLTEGPRPSAYHTAGASYAHQKAAQLDLTSHGNQFFYDKAGQPVAKSVNGGEDLIMLKGPDQIQNPATREPRAKVDVKPFTVNEPEPAGDPDPDGSVSNVQANRSGKGMPKRKETPGGKKAKAAADPVKAAMAPKDPTGKFVPDGQDKEWKDMSDAEVVHNLYHMTGGSDLALAWVNQKLQSASGKGEQQRLGAWKQALETIDTAQWPPSNKWHDMAKTTLVKSKGGNAPEKIANARTWMTSTLEDYKNMKTKSVTDRAKKVDGILRFSRALKALDAIEGGQIQREPVSFKNDPWYSLRYGQDRPEDTDHDAQVAAQAGNPNPNVPRGKDKTDTDGEHRDAANRAEDDGEDREYDDRDDERMSNYGADYDR